MNKSVWLARILSLGGILEAVVGLGLLVTPSDLSSFLLRSPLAGPGLVIARVGGGGLVALGIACWGARKTPSAPASLGVSWGFLAYNIVACATLAWAGPALASGGLPALGAAVLHGILGAGLLGALLGRGQFSAAS
jgi:hypothetical protein